MTPAAVLQEYLLKLGFQTDAVSLRKFSDGIGTTGKRILGVGTAVAGVVAWRMMDVGNHWASDVLFGATLGCVVGHTVAGKHKSLELAGFEIAPYLGDARTPAVGISLIGQF